MDQAFDAVPDPDEGSDRHQPGDLAAQGLPNVNALSELLEGIRLGGTQRQPDLTEADTREDGMLRPVVEIDEDAETLDCRHCAGHALSRSQCLEERLELGVLGG